METINRARTLPIFRIGETDFFVDTRLNEFREVDAPWNRISMDEVRETTDGATEMAYDLRTKSIYQDIIDPDNIPDHVILVIIPPLKELDPVGLARKSGLPDDRYIKSQLRVNIKNRQKGRRL